MARKSSRSSGSSAKSHHIARQSRLDPRALAATKEYLRQQIQPRYMEVSNGLPDRRAWAPRKFWIAPAATVRGASKLRPQFSPLQGLSARVRFAEPRFVLHCLRRKARREVLFALKRRARGSSAKKRKQTAYSGVSC